MIMELKNQYFLYCKYCIRAGVLPHTFSKFVNLGLPLDHYTHGERYSAGDKNE